MLLLEDKLRNEIHDLKRKEIHDLKRKVLFHRFQNE
jgi:hypothetical protein